MSPAKSQTTPNNAHLAHTTFEDRTATIAVSRDLWNFSHIENDVAAGQYSSTEMWVYCDQSASGPYHAIGSVKASYTQGGYERSYGKPEGHVSPTVATQGSGKSKVRKSEHQKKGHKYNSSKKKESSKKQ